jgi:hypothetical protein
MNDGRAPLVGLAAVLLERPGLEASPPRVDGAGFERALAAVSEGEPGSTEAGASPVRQAAARTLGGTSTRPSALGTSPSRSKGASGREALAEESLARAMDLALGGPGSVGGAGVTSATSFGEQGAARASGFGEQGAARASGFGERGAARASGFGEQGAARASGFGEQGAARASGFGEQGAARASGFGEQGAARASGFGEQGAARASGFGEQGAARASDEMPLAPSAAGPQPRRATRDSVLTPGSAGPTGRWQGASYEAPARPKSGAGPGDRPSPEERAKDAGLAAAALLVDAGLRSPTGPLPSDGERAEPSNRGASVLSGPLLQTVGAGLADVVPGARRSGQGMSGVAAVPALLGPASLGPASLGRGERSLFSRETALDPGAMLLEPLLEPLFDSPHRAAVGERLPQGPMQATAELQHDVALRLEPEKTPAERAPEPPPARAASEVKPQDRAAAVPVGYERIAPPPGAAFTEGLPTALSVTEPTAELLTERILGALDARVRLSERETSITVDLGSHGEVGIRLKVDGQSVTISVHGPGGAAVEARASELRAALATHGLDLAHLHRGDAGTGEGGGRSPDERDEDEERSPTLAPRASVPARGNTPAPTLRRGVHVKA